MSEEKVIENGAWMYASAVRLMATGIKLPPQSSKWLTQQRDKYYVEPGATVGQGLRDRMRRILQEAGLVKRRSLPRRTADRGLHAPEEPRASAPACLQGSRAPTPMPPWLVTGVGLPLRPPTRRAVGA